MSELSKEVVNDLSSLEVVVPDFRVQEKDIVFRRVGEVFQTRKSEIIGKAQTAHIVRGRFAAIYLMNKLRKRSSPTLGRIFGGRDHTTILTALKRVKTLLLSDPDFVERLRIAEELVYQDIEHLKARPIEPAQVRVY